MKLQKIASAASASFLNLIYHGLYGCSSPSTKELYAQSDHTAYNSLESKDICLLFDSIYFVICDDGSFKRCIR